MATFGVALISGFGGGFLGGRLRKVPPPRAHPWQIAACVVAVVGLGVLAALDIIGWDSFAAGMGGGLGGGCGFALGVRQAHGRA
jgi:hypothetical protein